MDRCRIGLTDMLHGDLLAHPGIVFDDTGQAPNSPVDLDVLWKLAKQDTPTSAKPLWSAQSAETSSVPKQL